MAGNPSVGGGRGRKPSYNNRSIPHHPSTSQAPNFHNRSLIDFNTNTPIDPIVDVKDDIYTLLKCPVCTQTMESPIYMCKSGHNVCHTCIVKSSNPMCRVCNNDMTTQRNLALEQLSLKVGIRCPNQKHGCTLISTREKIIQHIEYCQYLTYECPVKKFNMLCTWEGNISFLEDHFKTNHANYMIMKPGDPIIFKKINLNNQDSNIQLFTFNNLLFLYNICIDVFNKIASWTVQYIGCDKNASDWIFEIHIYNAKEPCRKITISEMCTPYGINPDQLFSAGRCVSIPLRIMKSFINENGDFTFKFYMKEKGQRR